MELQLSVLTPGNPRASNPKPQTSLRLCPTQLRRRARTWHVSQKLIYLSGLGFCEGFKDWDFGIVEPKDLERPAAE